MSATFDQPNKDLTMPASARAITVDALSIPVPEARWVREWREVGLDCVHVTVAIWEDARETLDTIARWDRVLDANRDLAAHATSLAEIRQIADSGRTAVLYGFQNTAPIEHDIELIGMFKRAGVSIMQLTYNLQNYIGCGYWEENDSGLSSRFGRLAVAEMNRVGVLIDLTHCGDRTTLDAIEASECPVAITHSNPREFVSDPPFSPGRLSTLEAMQACVARGGVVGLSPLDSISTPGANETVTQFAEMIARTAEKIGVESIGLGSDFCPGHPADIPTWWRYGRWSRERATPYPSSDEYDAFPDWFRPPDRLTTLRAALLAKGFDEREADGILGENWARLFETAFAPMDIAVGQAG
jgi:membrane dipeptidase